MNRPPAQPYDPPPALGRHGCLEVRLACHQRDIMKAQSLRYAVFYEELGAIPDRAMKMQKKDFDAFDPLCDHLLVCDHSDLFLKTPQSEECSPVIGTYRILHQKHTGHHGFYSEKTHDLQSLFVRMPSLTFAELGRACVLKPYRTRKTLELLWHGIWSYILIHKIDVMIGVASIPGVDPRKNASLLSFLYHNHRAPETWRVHAHQEKALTMNILPESALDKTKIFHTMPPLLKGYVHLGAYVGHEAVLDLEFQTTDVFIILPVKNINKRYIKYYGSEAERYK